MASPAHEEVGGERVPEDSRYPPGARRARAARRTSVSTMWVRSSGCSMMDMKDSPRFVETNRWAMASRRSGRKAWIRSRRWMACPMGAETRPHGVVGAGDSTDCELCPRLAWRSVQDSDQTTSGISTPPLGLPVPRRTATTSCALSGPSGRTHDSDCLGLLVGAVPVTDVKRPRYPCAAGDTGI